MATLGRFLMIDGAAAAAGGAVWVTLEGGFFGNVAAHGMRAVTGNPAALVLVGGLALIAAGWMIGRSAARADRR